MSEEAKTQIQELWSEISTVWNHGLLGVDVGSLITSLVILFGFLLIRGIFSKYILNRLHALTAKSENTVDDKIIDALIPPLRFIPVILGVYFAAKYAGIDEQMGEIFAKTIRSLIAFTMFWAIARALQPMTHAFRKLEKILTSTMMEWLFKIMRVLIIFIGAAVILEIWGIKIGPLLAGFGLFGVAIALGAQDVFKNLIGGITLIAEKKFQPGDWIKVDGVVEGTVDSIGFRSTQVRRFDKAPVQVPNSKLSDAAITNFSRMTHRRIYWKIGIEYSATTEQLKTVRNGIMDYIMNNDDFAKPPEVSTFVRLDAFNDSSIDFMIYCFTKTTDWGEWLEIKEAFALEIKDIVENKAKTGFAFPSQSIYIESMPDAPIQ